MNGGVSPLISALCNPAVYPHSVDRVEVLETHISWLVLAGDYAYKIKKPVDFGFLNFTDLAQRRFFCEEEIRLNTRFVSGIYLDVIAIGGSPAQPILGLEPAFEYAVRMQRFDARDLLDNGLQSGRLTDRHIDDLARGIAEFHRTLIKAATRREFGSAEAVMHPVRENIRQLTELLDEHARTTLDAIARASEDEWQRVHEVIDRRWSEGKVRECHGDLHLGNIVLIDDRPCPFDGIEFSESLRWIDVINDIAFLVMDLRYRRRTDWAFRFLNTYLEVTGDYDGLSVLRFYEAYRAMVKAKVSALRAAQNGEIGLRETCSNYMALALEILQADKPALLITYGLPGCGKTVVSQYLLERLPAIRIRSDVERKRLFGLNATDRPGAELALYTADATEKTYHRLAQLSEALLKAGYVVIVDAAFLKKPERDRFAQLAGDLDVPFVVLEIVSDEAVQRQRLKNRRDDASDADEAVLDVLRKNAEPLEADERSCALRIHNNRDGLDDFLSPADWANLKRLLR